MSSVLTQEYFVWLFAQYEGGAGGAAASRATAKAKPDWKALSKSPAAAKQRWVVPTDAPGWGPSVIEQVAPFVAASQAPLEIACQYVMAIGYQPSECLIETRLGTDSFSRHDTLKVRGEAVFEVVTTRTVDPGSDMTINLTIAPRWLTMPPAVVRTEPIQSRRHPPGSGGGPPE